MVTLTFSTTSPRAIDRLRAQAPTATARAINRSIASAKTAMVREISRDLGVKAGDLRDKIVVREATPTRHVARLYASAKRIPLIDFAARGPEPSRGLGRGVSAKLTASRTRYPHAFIATMTSRHRGVYMRTGKGRLPIRELFGPSIAHVFAKHEHVGIARGQEQLLKNLKSEFRYALSQTG